MSVGRETADSSPYSSLRHYGLSFAETEPRGWAKTRIMGHAFGCLRRELGFGTTLWTLARSRLLARKADGRVLASIRGRGLEDRGFIAARVEETSLAAALVENLGMERAGKVYGRVLEQLADEVMMELVPSAEELNAFDDPFIAFRAYLVAVLEANTRAAIHVAEVREDTEDVFAYDVTYCAYERVGAAFGDPMLCQISSCAGDDVSFPRMCAKIGARFLRKGTLASGAPCCDFRFERIR